MICDRPYPMPRETWVIGYQMTTFAWAKLWIETLDDFKMGQLPDHLWRRFFEFVLLAKSQDDHGYLPDTRAMAWRLRCSEQEVVTDLEALAGDGLALITQQGNEWFVTNYEKRQDKPMPDAERKQKQRERELRDLYESRDGHEQVTPRDTEKRREEEEEKEAEAECPAIAEEEELPPPLQTRTISQADIANPDPELVAAWEQAKPELRVIAGASQYESWLEPIHPVCIKDGTAVFITPVVFASEWCTTRFKRQLCNTLSGILGRPVDVSVAIQPGGT